MTKEQALQLQYRQEIHYGTCKQTIGPRGGVTNKQEIWRVNGAVKLWKTRPEDFQIPIKYGFNGPYHYIAPSNVADFHLSSECEPEVHNKQSKPSWDKWAEKHEFDIQAD